MLIASESPSDVVDFFLIALATCIRAAAIVKFEATICFASSVIYIPPVKSEL